MKSQIVFDNLMVDIETMGDESFSAIVAIAAVEFNMEGQTGRVFYKQVDLASCLDAGLKVSANTIEWWMGQNNEVRGNLFKGEKVGINGALTSLIVWIGQRKYLVWGNSALFDLGLLRNAFAVTCNKTPWSYKDERCLRTLVALLPEVKEQHVFKGIAHHPIDDCLNQIEYGCETWRMLKSASVK